jgi:broad specificity phosphatase PhoE
MTPRIILARHGETAWTLTGAHTSTTDLELTARGKDAVAASAAHTVGKGLAIDPERLAHIIVSPRIRAQQTYKILLPTKPEQATEKTDERVREWTYGGYEGKTPKEIKEMRIAEGLDKERKFDFWREGAGAAGGESPAEISARIDEVIAEIQARHRVAIENKDEKADVLIVSHGHFLRAFAKRWLGYELATPLIMVLDPGGVGVLSYAHNSVDEPAFVLGGVYQ